MKFLAGNFNKEQFPVDIAQDTEMSVADTVVIFGCGDITKLVAEHAAKKLMEHYELYGFHPSSIIISEGFEKNNSEFNFLQRNEQANADIIKDILVKNDIPEKNMIINSAFKNTVQNIRSLDSLWLADEKGAIMFFGIAHHMRRIVETFFAQTKNPYSPLLILQSMYPKGTNKDNYADNAMTRFFVDAEMQKRQPYYDAGFTKPFDFERNRNKIIERNVDFSKFIKLSRKYRGDDAKYDFYQGFASSKSNVLV